MFTSKINESFIQFYDTKKRLLKIMGAIFVIYFLHAFFMPALPNYFEYLHEKYSLAGIDNIYEYTLPVISMLLMFFAFVSDYTKKKYELLTFYNASSFNSIMLFRWLYIAIPMNVIIVVTAPFYYRSIAFLDVQSLYLSIRFIPNVLFVTALFLLCMTMTKNGYAALVVTSTYLLLDILSSARIFKIVSLGANSYNYYYSISPTYYLINRLLLVVLSLLFIYVACKKSSKVR